MLILDLRGSPLEARYVSRYVACCSIISTTQKHMSDLPKDRLQPSPLFLYAVVDIFDAFSVKEGRGEPEGYGCSLLVWCQGQYF